MLAPSVVTGCYKDNDVKERMRLWHVDTKRIKFKLIFLNGALFVLLCYLECYGHREGIVASWATGFMLLIENHSVAFICQRRSFYFEEEGTIHSITSLRITCRKEIRTQSCLLYMKSEQTRWNIFTVGILFYGRWWNEDQHHSSEFIFFWNSGWCRGVRNRNSFVQVCIHRGNVTSLVSRSRG